MRKIFLFCFLSIACFGYSAKDLSLEEKVGQLLMVHFKGQQANDDAKTLVNDIKVGGFIYYNWANGLTSPEQVKSLGLGLQKLAKETQLSIPLFIAADQEGGLVARLSQGFTIFPGNKALGMTGKPRLAEQSAYAMGKELQAVGVNFNLSPDVDVNINPRNPVIGIRSFSDLPELVVIFGEKALLGYRKAGIITSLKHFPGHGDVEIDSHQDLPVVNKSKEQLDKTELLPFAWLADQADTIMTAHLLVPALDPDHCSTLSKKTLDFLKKDLGFKGAIISDSLVMEGVLKKCGTVDEAAIQALRAGCDILILGGRQLIGGNNNIELTVTDVKRIHQNLVAAVKSGRISEQRVDEAVEKVLALKLRYLMSPKEKHAINTPEHQQIAKKIAARALRMIKNNPSSLESLSQKKVAVIAPEIIKNEVQKTTLASMGNIFYFEGLNPSEMILQQAESAEVVIFCSYNAWKNPGQASCINTLLTKKPVILFVMRDPLDAELFPKADVIIKTYSPTEPSIQAACDQLIAAKALGNSGFTMGIGNLFEGTISSSAP
jgi:beta-N-acetylhexosaminidase